MRSSFSSLALCFLLLTACAPNEEKNTRTTINALTTGVSKPVLDESIEDIYEPASSIDACALLDSLPTEEDPSNRFRLLGESNVSDPSLSDVLGTVDIGASPLYQYAILTQQIPDEKEFLALLDQEYAKATSFGDNLKLGLVKFLLNLGILNPISLRNSIVEDKILEALPGAFETAGAKPVFADSIPGALLRNGNPHLARLSSSESDDDETKRNKLKSLKETLAIYQKPLPLFSQGGWDVFANEMHQSLSAGIRGLNLVNTKSRACATVLLHRQFAQLLAIMGYQKPVIEERAPKKLSFFPPFAKMLRKEDGTELQLCPSPGSFLENNEKRVLSRQDITSATSYFELAATPQLSLPCDKISMQPSGASFTAASGTSLSAFLSGAVNFAFAFNPSAFWWQVSTVGFPLSPFESIETIHASGALLPSDAHALALGFVKLGFDNLLKKHFIFIDDNKNIVSDTKYAAALLISDSKYESGKVITPITLASNIVEVAFKFSEHLRLLAEWKTNADLFIEQELARTTDVKKRIALKRDYRLFIEGLFGSEETLMELLNQSHEDSPRVKMKSLTLASSILATKFIRKVNGRTSCFNQLEFDPVTKKETLSGVCSKQEELAWKYGLSLAARAFKSPYFRELARP